MMIKKLITSQLVDILVFDFTSSIGLYLKRGTLNLFVSLLDITFDFSPFYNIYSKKNIPNLLRIQGIK